MSRWYDHPHKHYLGWIQRPIISEEFYNDSQSNLNQYFFRQSTGKLIVYVIETNTGKPIGRAKVTISDQAGKIMTTLQTNESGQTGNIVLPAPPKEYSFKPSGPKPYSVYNVTVEAPGYGTVIIRGVQIFGEATAEQKVELTRSQVRSDQPKPIIINIPEHKLYGQYPELLPQGHNPGFYSEVRIPRYIIVHDGHPFHYGRKYAVKFIDYIKNVATSELYPPWPVEAIKANVLSIISFALNRVHTKHYQSIGFDISSSTMFDQKFVPGQSIFTKIDKIVDEMFNCYIVKPGQLFPILAHRCSGKSPCPSGYLSQWGSKYLADQGKTVMDILYYYYGNVEIRCAHVY